MAFSLSNLWGLQKPCVQHPHDRVKLQRLFRHTLRRLPLICLSNATVFPDVPANHSGKHREMPGTAPRRAAPPSADPSLQGRFQLDDGFVQ